MSARTIQKLRTAIHNQKAINKNAESVQPKIDKKENEEFKEVYEEINRRLYDMAAEQQGYPAQAQRADVVSFLVSFCQSASSSNNRLRGSSGHYLMKRELSKWAKKEYALKQKTASHMWEAQSWF